ncbi:hypothetical protein [Georgenia subflava]|uniref:Transcriptional regulator n=1 Tax=Georgenia subflava TaxID=1622177 RepID=A0A6N7EP91_9MICO|nr:hypothetical protein [Georgenia subflava]MPV37966.1 hypothetical protein [Georgenia subflava]
MIIGVVGAQDLVPVVSVAVRDALGVRTVEAGVAREEDTLDAVASVTPQVDALLFTGIAPYTVASGSLTRPATFVDYTGTTLLRALLLHQVARPALQWLSIDTLPAADTIGTLVQSGYDADKIDVLPFRRDGDTAKFVDFHTAFAAAHPDALTVTCHSQTFAALVGAGVPAVHLVPSETSIVGAARLLLQEANSALGADSSVVIAQVRRRDDRRVTDEALQGMAVRLAGTAVSDLEGRQFVVTTRGMLLQASEGLSRLSGLWVADAYDVHIGVGIGNTAGESFRLAGHAMTRAATRPGSAAVVETRGSSVVLTPGRPAAAEPPQESLSTIAHRTGLSVQTLVKVRDAVGPERDGVTTQSLAEVLEVKPRTARRWLTSLENGGFARRTGTLRSGVAGRPLETYELLLP